MDFLLLFLFPFPSRRFEDFARKSCFLWLRYIRRYRVAATQPDPGSSPQLTMRKVGFEWSSRKVHRSRLAVAIDDKLFVSNSAVFPLGLDFVFH